MNQPNEKRRFWKRWSFWTHSFLIVSLALMTSISIVLNKWLGVSNEAYFSQFQGIELGMSKQEMFAIIARPISIDTVRGLEELRYDTPIGYSDFPTFYFDTANDKLVKFYCGRISAIDSTLPPVL